MPIGITAGNGLETTIPSRQTARHKPAKSQNNVRSERS